MSARLDGRAAPASHVPREGGQVVEMQRRRLLLSICEVVGEDGLEAATVGRICEQAGVSRRTFYEIFPDREACLLAALDMAVARISALVGPAYRRAARWDDRVRDALCLMLEQLDTEPHLARLCVLETLRAGPAVLERRRQVLEALAVALDEGRTSSRASTAPPPLTAQGIVGGALSVIHARLLSSQRPTGTNGAAEPAGGGDALPLVELAGPLMAMIVHPYLGPAAARRELQRPAPSPPRAASSRAGADPFKGLPIRFTYRTARVLSTIASEGRRGSYPSNRLIADASGIADDGQMSRLLRRLHGSGLVENRGHGHSKGEPNAWALTERGAAIHAAIAVNDSTS